MVCILAYGPSCPWFNSQHSQTFWEEKIINVAEVNQRRWLEKSGQWLKNVDWTYLALASGKPVPKKLPDRHLTDINFANRHLTNKYFANFFRWLTVMTPSREPCNSTRQVKGSRWSPAVRALLYQSGGLGFKARWTYPYNYIECSCYMFRRRKPT